MIPGPKSLALGRRLKRVESRNITYLHRSFPVFWESASGSRVRDVDGHSYLDLTSAFGVSSLGHLSPAVQTALSRQSRKMWHGMGDVHPSAVKVELLEALAHVAPGALSVSILSSTGAEAVESALKSAYLATRKPGVIAFHGGYHGLSYGTLAVTDGDRFTGPFRKQSPSFSIRVPFPDPLRGPSEQGVLERLEQVLRRKQGLSVGAILIEPIQGRGGIRIGSDAFLFGLRALCKRFGLLLIADEIMTGLGRTGELFAMNHSRVVPDLLCVGKALGNGFPISACLGTPSVMKAWPPSDGEAIHTSTFLGNPLGCAMALASLRELQAKRLTARARDVGQRWLHQLQQALGDHPRVGDIRGRGLMIGIELVKNRKANAPDAAFCSRIVVAALKKRVLLLSNGLHRNVLTLLPPLTISERDLTEATEVLKGLFYGKA